MANYRDSTRCAETLRSLLTQAARPDLVAISLVDQVYASEASCVDAYCKLVGDAICRQAPLRRQVSMDAAEATGPTAARYVAEAAIDSRVDTFALGIDSHLVFVHHWDVRLKDEWDAVQNPFAILTTYPKSTDHATRVMGRLLHAIGVYSMSIMCYARIETDDEDAMVQYSAPHQDWSLLSPSSPRLIAQFAGGFNFGPAAHAVWVRNDPYTPYLFHGEEYSMAARLFTHGYDLYAPRVDIVYHWYEHRHVIWERDWDTRYFVQQASKRRVRAMLGLPITTFEDVDRTELSRFGLGQERTMDQFIAFSGIDPLAEFIKGETRQFDNCKLLTRVPTLSETTKHRAST
ncbi:hypothetical protein SPRG_20220 [Saprolegnia parasitica CBS 223.65]|uniref:Glycosyltransferase (GlcNAc) n=1 Tax=Saprolegnia parasitica (strain CBS 223.65) TaxID=695850 RepID=A0A067CML4_SAPPC|nr:hypothetical protein SPRG_20220 [Saprolegnia parasitica CBS 223.65]KDO28062.1 hypothetical protein SPRG_20220 [Saprolegnia parasitica CBS 223.65]|eukprot:XP_012201209.1 hypothetical protein SPRG_20220 [Saprolegnia parasitica CBS 223.65]